MIASSLEQVNNLDDKVTSTRFLVSLASLLLAWVLVYQDALIGMEAIWSRSDTFAHGYFILPISLWLLWRDKANLLSSTVQATWLPLPLLVISLFVGLFAYAADINVLRQLSSITSLIFLLWALVGNQLAWRYKFPLVYLLFAVPMGENLIPWLQDVTAWFTVFFLTLNGIPVYVDGLYIQIPTGMFEVAVACSGIRYLIASVAVGSLYGYLTYNKIHKQLIFFAFALFLPILANGIRAYGIVAIAYYSDMEYATGADHLIYGWLFFGLIIMLMFWIGGFFADNEVNLKNARDVDGASKSKPMFRFSSTSIVTIILPILGITFYILQEIPIVNMANEQTIEFENSSLAKNNKQTKGSLWGISFIHALQTVQEVDLHDVEVFYAVYANKQAQGELISWENVTHDHDRWTIVSTKELTVDSKPAMLVHLRSINGLPRSYLYQYKVGDFYTVNKNKAKLMQAWNSLTRQSDFSEVRAVSIGEKEVNTTQLEVELVNEFLRLFKVSTDMRLSH